MKSSIFYDINTVQSIASWLTSESNMFASSWFSTKAYIPEDRHLHFSASQYTVATTLYLWLLCILTRVVIKNFKLSLGVFVRFKLMTREQKICISCIPHKNWVKYVTQTYKSRFKLMNREQKICISCIPHKNGVKYIPQTYKRVCQLWHACWNKHTSLSSILCTQNSSSIQGYDLRRHNATIFNVFTHMDSLT
jgi:hypothetical protein